MNAFAELFARYPEELMDLCEREAEDDKRAWCLWGEESDPENKLCILCDRHYFCDGTAYGPTCNADECLRLYGWLQANKEQGGYRHRQAFRDLFGKSWLQVVPHAMRREAVLAAMLRHEALERERNGRQNIRRAA